MGYPCQAIEWPAEAEVHGHVGADATGMFYELAHGGSTYFKSGCTAGTSYEYTRASEVEAWIADYPKMPFTFIGSCDGLCSTGDGSLSYEFRKGSGVDTATVGYCGMSGSDCSLCWIYSLFWQNAFFGYLNSGYTVKAAYDEALADYPMCASPYDCMRFAGDESFAGPYVRPGPSPSPSSSSAPAPATPVPTPSPAPSPVPTATVWTPSAWPAGAGTEIGSLLPSGYEPSGLVWHQRLGVLFLVSDDGWISWMDQSGNSPVTWTPGGDLEGIAVADADSDYLYLGVEDPDSIREFDLTTGALTGKSWDLTPWMTGAAGEGLEALTFVPDGDHPYAPSGSGGLFYAGLQADGRIYVFDADLARSGVVSHIDTIEPYPGLTDLSGLHYHAETGVLYAVFDTWNLLLEMETDGTVIEAFLLPGDTQEGVTLMTSCPASATSIFIAEDAGEVWRYDGYPVICLATPTPSPTATAVSTATATPPPATPPPATPTPVVTPTPYSVVWRDWPGLVGRWTFDEGGGLTARDVAGENDGTLLGIGEEAWDEDGRFGGCVSFGNLAGERVDCGSASELNLQTEGTVVAWVFNRTLPEYRGYFGRYPDWVTGGWYLTPVAGNKLKLVAWDADGDYNARETSGLTTGTWQFVAWRWQSGVATVFVDGMSVTGPSAGAAIRSCPAGSFEIGRYHPGGVSFDGKIDEVSVFSRALSDSEISQVRNNATTPPATPTPEAPPSPTPTPYSVVWRDWPGLVGRWTFDEGGGLTAPTLPGRTTGPFWGSGRRPGTKTAASGAASRSGTSPGSGWTAGAPPNSTCRRRGRWWRGSLTGRFRSTGGTSGATRTG